MIRRCFHKSGVSVQAGFLIRKQAQKLLAGMVLLDHRACNKVVTFAIYKRKSGVFCRSVQALGDADRLCCSGGGPGHLLQGSPQKHHIATL